MGKPSRRKRAKAKKRATRRRAAKGSDASQADLKELQDARALWQREQYDAALDGFDRTLKRHPNHRLALVDAARAFGARYEIDRAEALVERSIELGRGEANVLHLAGQSYRMMHRPDKAIMCFQRAIEADGNLADSHLELAILYERGNRLSEARLHVDECLKLKGEYVEAQLVKARLLRRGGEETSSENILRDLAPNKRSHPIVRAQAWSELSTLLDARGDYDEAFEAAVRSNRLLSQQESAVWKQSQSELANLCHLVETVTSGDFRRWRDAAAAWPVEPVALLTGPPRSGTTLLEKVLDAHGQVIASDERDAFARYIFPAMLGKRESPLLGADVLEAAATETLLAERKRYLCYMEAALAEPLAGRLLIDKNPSTLMLAPGMLRLFPECRLLVALRDPRDVVLSCFVSYFPPNTVSVHFLTLQRTAERYVRDMQAWLKLREIIPDGWLEVRYEDLVDDLPSTARRATDFLGLPWDDAVLTYRDRLADRQINSPTYEAVAKPIYRSAIGRWQNYRRPLEPVLSLLEPLVRSLGYS